MNKKNQYILGLVGSPNKDGRTYELVNAVLAGAASVGTATELVQMSDCVVGPCHDCLPWVCEANLKCSYEDPNFTLLSEKILNCGALVLGTPVYLGETSAMVKYLFLKMTRVFTLSGKLNGLPALGISMAGMSGNGLITALNPVYHFFRIMRMRAIEPLPSTRFNLEKSKKAAEILGQRLANMLTDRVPFKSPEEGERWYENMYFVGERRAEERRLMAAIAYDAIPVERKKEVDGKLVQTSILKKIGQSEDAANEVKKVYNSCLKIIDEK
jgi:multimeric flavodoxin WrbA